MVRVLAESRGKTAFIVQGTSGWSAGYRDLVAAGLLRRLHPRSRVVVSDATMEPGSRAVTARLPRPLRQMPEVVSRLIVRSVDGPNVTWCVLSRQEAASFAQVWGLLDADVLFTPFSHTIYDERLLHGDDSSGGYFFAGGNSLRDYAMLIGASQGLDVQVEVATEWRPAQPVPNVHFATTSHVDFLALMSKSVAVVLPLEASVRSTGQQTYLNAMALGKVVIVNDAPGVVDHIENGTTGVIVRGADEMRAAMVDVLKPERAEHYRAMGAAAREWVLNGLTPEHYRRQLLRVALKDVGSRPR